MQRVTVVTDLQFGSTGKGLLAGTLARVGRHTAVATGWAPNAGHTFIDRDGRKYVHTQLANAVAAGQIAEIFIGPGSVLHPQNLLNEMASCSDLMANKRITIHAQAAVVKPEHIAAEDDLIRIGSTQKGAWAAVAARAARDPSLRATAATAYLPGGLDRCVVTPDEYQRRMDMHDSILLEGHQGFSLSIYHGLYPYTTSRDTTTHALLADAGMRHGRFVTVWGCLRSFPIRVSNRYTSEGVQVGTSGPGYADQQETTWDAVGVAPELTTVTKRERRIFTYSSQQVTLAARMNGVNRVFANFVNYLPEEQREAWLWRVAADTRVPKRMIAVGNGPTEDDIDFDWAVHNDV